MKKLFSLLLVLGLLLAVSSLTFAVAGNISKNNATPLSISNTISAYVNPYASIDWGVFTPPTHLTGAAGEIQTGSLEFTVAVNCAVDLLMSATAMNNHAEQREHTNNDLATFYAVTTGNNTPNYTAAPLEYDNVLDQESQDFTLHYQVEDGAQIYSQHAGNYRAFVTVTVIARSY